MHTPRVVIWTTTDPESTRTALRRHAARPRLLVPVPHGTFVLGPDPHTSDTVADNLRAVKGVRVGLVWTETTAWIVYFDGVVRGWRLGPDDSFEPAAPKQLPDGLGWLSEAVEAVRAQGVLDGLGALRTALESAGFALDAAALVKIDAGEVDDAVPHHEKRWWERLFGERSGMSEAQATKPVLHLIGALVGLVVCAWVFVRAPFPTELLAVLYVLTALAIVMVVGQGVVAMSRVRLAEPFPERDVLGMSAWARAAEEE